MTAISKLERHTNTVYITHEILIWLLVLLQRSSSPFTVFRRKYNLIHCISPLLCKYTCTRKKTDMVFPCSLSTCRIQLREKYPTSPKISNCKCYSGTSEEKHRGCPIFFLACLLSTFTKTKFSSPLATNQAKQKRSLKIYRREDSK